MTLRALIFDVDGTLAETEEAHRAAFNQAFAEAGLNWHWTVDDYRRLLETTGGKERKRRHRDDLAATWPDDEQIAELHRRRYPVNTPSWQVGEPVAIRQRWPLPSRPRTLRADGSG